MSAPHRTQSLQEDLRRTASELEAISRALQGHAAYLSRGSQQADIALVHQQIHDLQASVSELRGIADAMTPTSANPGAQAAGSA
ncbi:hypothetical protein [Pseudomonas entomophila]|uniref:hypothetical protein n=1 Tax=Pseudomonas entomophila TaxID=312306 RepID=UPI003EC0B114